MAAAAPPFAAGAILLAALVSFNAATPKKNSKTAGMGISDRRSIDKNRLMQSNGTDFTRSLSSARRSPSSTSRGPSRSAQSHWRSYSPNRNLYHPPSVTTPISETLHYRHSSIGSAGSKRTSGNSRRAHTKPGYHTSQTIPAYAFPKRHDLRKPVHANTYATGYQADRDLRIPATHF